MNGPNAEWIDRLGGRAARKYDVLVLDCRRSTTRSGPTETLYHPKPGKRKPQQQQQQQQPNSNIESILPGHVEVVALSSKI
jgi:hypothetical protein